MTSGPTSAPTSALSLEEAVPLGYALLARVAADRGIRLLAIKGPVLTLQGLRPERQSVDVDVLVEPRRFADLTAALADIGWADSGFYDTPGLVPHHSATWRHPRWPNEIDVHHWFPGFLGDPQVVFDELWRTRETVVVAHHAVQAPGLEGHAALAALHYLRDESSAHSMSKLDDLVVAARDHFDPSRLAALCSLAAATGSAETLRPFLRALGADDVASTTPLVIPLADWEMRTRAESREVLRWLVGMDRVSWWRRPGFLFRAVWPTTEQVRLDSDTTIVTRGDAVRARWARIRRALRALPSAYDEWRRLRSGG